MVRYGVENVIQWMKEKHKHWNKHVEKMAEDRLARSLKNRDQLEETHQRDGTSRFSSSTE